MKDREEQQSQHRQGLIIEADTVLLHEDRRRDAVGGSYTSVDKTWGFGDE